MPEIVSWLDCFVRVFSGAVGITNHRHDKRGLFIGCGFSPGQLAVVVQLAHGYSVEREISTWVFDKPIPDELRRHPDVKRVLANYRIIVESRSAQFRRLLFSGQALLVFLESLMLALRAGRRGLLSDHSWLRTQLLHSIWDTARMRSGDGAIRLGFLRKFESALRVTYAGWRAQQLVRIFGIGGAFLGHTVYECRAVLAYFREANVDTIAHAMGAFYRLPADFDNSWSLLSHPEWESLKQLSGNVEVQSFWNERASGNSYYEDAVAAFTGSHLNVEEDFNLIFLHVFRDSPFNSISRHRIFSDYVEWVRTTLDIARGTEEKWLIRPHPSAARWGESQETWIKALMGCGANSERRSPNIQFLHEKVSNFSLIRQAKRIVTFGGTVHLEAAAIGKRAIAIAETCLSIVSPGSVITPVRLEEYRQVLAEEMPDGYFELEEKQIETARKLLFTRERILSFSRDVGAITVYRGDSPDLLRQEGSSVIAQLEHSAPMLRRQGAALAKGQSRTLAFDYFERWMSGEFVA